MAHTTLRTATLYSPLRRDLLAAFTNRGRPKPFPKIARGLGNINLFRGFVGAGPNRGSGWSIAGIAAPASFAAMKIDPGGYHLIIVYYFARSTIYQLNVAIPLEKRVFGFSANDIQVFCQGNPLDKFLRAKFERIRGKKEKKLCMSIARWCATGRMRSIHRIDNPCNEGSYIAEVEVGRVEDWAENRRKPYTGGKSVFTGRLDEGVVVQLCEGELVRW